MKDLDFQQVVTDCQRRDIHAVMDFVGASAPKLLATLSTCFKTDEDPQRHAQQVLTDTYTLCALNVENFESCDNRSARYAFFEVLARRLSFSKAILAKEFIGQLQSVPAEDEALAQALHQLLPIPDGIEPPMISGIQLHALMMAQSQQVHVDSSYLAHVERLLRYHMGMHPLGYAANGEGVYPDSFDPRLGQNVRRHRQRTQVILAVRYSLVNPILDACVRLIAKFGWGRRAMVQYGLPRRLFQQRYGEQLRISIDPKSIRKMGTFKRQLRKKMNHRLIWDGDWDTQVKSFTHTSRHIFISDIWQHRDHIERSDFYRKYMGMVDQGKPFVDHYSGVALTSHERIIGYVQLYLFYMYNMACFGFTTGQSKDDVWVALDRNAEIVKVKHGLHRTAMAQVIGLRQIDVSVRAVHRLWWQQAVTERYDRQRLLEQFFGQLQQSQKQLQSPELNND